MDTRRFTRWHAAGLLLRHFPDVRGRDRLFSLISGQGVPPSLGSGPYDIEFGPGLRARVQLTEDGSFGQVFFSAYVAPALAPVLEAVLGPGDCFWDVGANLGVYSLWADTIVGSAGAVYAFEPVPNTRRWLADLVAQNDARVSVEAYALSDHDANVRLVTVANASGLSHIADGTDEDVPF